MTSEWDKFKLAAMGTTVHGTAKRWITTVDHLKAQFRKLRKEHVEFVLLSMDSNTTKARNIRAVLITALYNAVNTMGSYYGNLVRYHMEEERRGDKSKKDV